MIELKQTNVGPIIGETTANSVRLWGRGKRPKSLSDNVHGVARVLQGATELGLVIFKMTKTWDYTGVGVIEGLQGSTEYEYQFAYFHDPRDTSAIDVSHETYNWDPLPKYEFITASNNCEDPRSYLLGSCRYNLPWADDDKDHTDTRGDKTFRAMLAQIADRPANALVMLGDQIYSDILGVGVSSPEAFHSLYRGAFRQESLRKLMQHLPTYMTLDDHEIEDNWPKRRSCRDYNKVVAAKYAYQAYQASHSPVLGYVNGRLDGLPEHFWYQFRDGCCEFFMLDVRTERNIESGEIISENQLEALQNFLRNGSGLVKIVGSAVPFILDGGEDTWSGFPEQRNRILNCIRENRVRNVLFVSGDVHFSAVADLHCDQDPDFRILNFICSPFFWPFPHWGKLKNQNIIASNLTYRPNILVEPYRKENFVRLTVKTTEVRFEIFPRKGHDPVTSIEIQLQ